MRIRRAVVVVCVVAAMAACKKNETRTDATTTSPAVLPTDTSATAAATEQPANPEKSLVSIGVGAVVVQKPQEENDAYGAYRLMDEASDRGWSTPDGVVSPQTIVISLPGQSEISRVEFDTEGLKEGRAARNIVVEVSDTSATTGFTKIVQAALREGANHQSIPATATAPARWVRLTVQDNHGDPNNIELLEFRAFGRQLTQAPPVNVTGDYTSNEGDMQLRQNGAAVIGCYGTNAGRINGGIDGRTMRFTWSQAGGDAGTAVVNFTDDGKEFFGIYWNKGETGAGSVWSGSRATEPIAGCGLTAGSGQDQIAGELEKEGRSRVYGILFDPDSAKIKPESKPVLDDILAVLRTHGNWTLMVEGHTDSTGTEAHNQQLSEQRAAAVKSYLVTAGVDAGRLTTGGFGASKPVAPNDTEIGRAQNRRVELVKPN